MKLSDLTKAITVHGSTSSPELIEQLKSPSVTDDEVINMFNKANSRKGNKHELFIIAENLFTRKLKQLKQENNTRVQINIIADLLAIMFFKR